jgi:hypothetical protein
MAESGLFHRLTACVQMQEKSRVSVGRILAMRDGIPLETKAGINLGGAEFDSNQATKLIDDFGKIRGKKDGRDR